MTSVYERDYSTQPPERDARDGFHTQAELDAEIARQLVEHARQLQQERAFGLAMERGRGLAAAFLGFVLVGLGTHTGSIDR